MYTEEERETILRMREEKMTWEAIGLALKKNPGALCTWFSRWQERTLIGPRVVARKKKVRGRLGLQVKHLVMEQPTLSIRKLQPALQQVVGPDIQVPSGRTLARYLAANGFEIIRALKKPLVSAKNRQLRVDWALEMQDTDPELWDMVIWSDETTVRSMPQAKEVHFWIHSSTPRNNMPINFQVQGGGFSVMFWGAFSKTALGPLVAIEGTLNSEKYIELLKEHLLPELRAARRPMIFQQDNAPCHKSAPVRAFLAANQVRTMKWPAQSPDMNPIENLWAILKRKRQEKFGVPKTKSELIDQIFEIWDSFEVELLHKLADSIDNRLKLVVASSGKPTKY